ncbi:hypothetical protein SBA5_70134 [Candidatus Sulfotelmatomonas gaucii]|uniref:Uncharacterized protein n=1 Tax=Candidatus Sulfuritelmatomonas gaucii TaxID=2043161 RepID=A0A2N9M0S3_9BACT|nr:hypothetical protein SBA5_70134 [Candidatus Sulfotelmatomonas gaucii]
MHVWNITTCSKDYGFVVISSGDAHHTV